MAKVMGVLNVTPDSFSDGGDFFSADLAVTHAKKLLADGASFVDVGAESTRPGSVAVNEEEEWNRVSPVLHQLCSMNLGPQISLDTRRDETILRAVKLGVGTANNICGLYDLLTLRELSRIPNFHYVCMHSQGEPATMQKNPLRGAGAIEVISDYFATCYEKLRSVGFRHESLYFDPGIGFAKDDSANLRILGNVRAWSTRYQMLVGVSRKSFIGRLFGIEDAKNRDAASKAFEFSAVYAGALMIRTHEVGSLVNMLRMTDSFSATEGS